VSVIIDGHCHAWESWPYEPTVPDRQERGRVEQLLFEMDCNGVDRALIVCAQIDHNPANNRYVAEVVGRHTDRLYQVADLDSFWSSTYHRPGAAQRLRSLAEAMPLAGFTHYLAPQDDGWLESNEAEMLFSEVARHRLLASISCHPHQVAALCHLALCHPDVPVLLHHFAHVRVVDPETVQQLLACKSVENVFVKVSGFYYATAGPKWDFPIRDVQEIVRILVGELGPDRLCWGSDYPVARQFITHRQSLDILRTHCDFIRPADRDKILGDTLAAILDGLTS
jgi:L-fuconolactonase